MICLVTRAMERGTSISYLLNSESAEEKRERGCMPIAQLLNPEPKENRLTCTNAAPRIAIPLAIRHHALRLKNPYDRSFPCPYLGCDYAATQLGNLTRHIKTHTRKKPFKCAYP